MIGGRRPVAGLDLGASKTCAVILAPVGFPEEPARVLGVGLAATEGIREETVTDLEAAAASVRRALEEAELMAGLEVTGVYAGLADEHVGLDLSTGVVALGGAEVTTGDVERVHEVGRAVVVPPDRHLLHALPQEYVLDGRRGIETPVGMPGTRLEAEVCIVTASADACVDLRRAVDRAGYRVEEVVLEPLAGSLAVLREAEREMGVAMVELGAGRTDAAVFRGGKLTKHMSLPWGGATLTRDVVKGLGLPLEEAERLKREYGAAVTERVDPDGRIEVPGPPGPTRRISQELLAHIIEQRLDEIFGLVYDDLAESGDLDDLPGGVVLSGGGVTLPGTVELARSVFNLPVRIGEPGRDLAGFADAVRKPKFTTAVGLAQYGAARRNGAGGTGAGRVLVRVSDWLRDFF